MNEAAQRASQPILAQVSSGAAVAVIRLRSMGDTVLTTPALALLRRARPDLRVFVVLELPWDQLVQRNPDVAGIIAVDANGGFAHRWAAIRGLRRLRPELCLNFHGGSTSALLTAFSGARWRAGFGHFPWSFVYNVRIPRAQEILGRETNAPVHTAEHLASGIFYLGAAREEIPRARLFASGTARPGSRRPYAVVHVAAASDSKQWPPQRFAEVAGWLRRNHGLQPLMLCGPGQGDLLAGMDEFERFDNLSLDQMMSLMEGAQLFVGNDSGPAHVAAAFGVPCVVIFGSSNARVWHPWGTPHQSVQSSDGILSVDVGTVEQAVANVLPARPALQHD